MVFSEPVRYNQSAESILADVFFQNGGGIECKDFTEFIDSLTSIIEKTASVYRAADHVGL